MNTRILTIVGAATLLCTMSGCSGMRHFLFGRGAKCGLCSRAATPVLGGGLLNRTGQIAVPQTLAPAPVLQNQLAHGTGLSCGTEAGCGLEASCGHEATCGREAISNSCNCGGNHFPGVSSYGPQVSAPVVSDPYLSGNVIGGEIIGNSFPVEGQVIDGGFPVGGGAINGFPANGQVIDGGFPVDGQVITDGSWYNAGPRQISNRVDQDGHRILSEDPLPPGAIPLN